MSDVVIIVNTLAAVLATVVLIVRFRFNPVVSLVIGAAYLGLATGQGVDGTVKAITGGFGDIMADVGLLIAFGVLTGAMLQSTGAIERLVQSLMRICGPRGMPYAFSLTIATVLQSIFLDVLLVISAPLARSFAGRVGKVGLARMATALAISLECGIVFMVPGVASIALAGLLGVPLGTMLLFGFVLIVPTVAISVTIMSLVFRRGWWDEAKDQLPGAPAPAPGDSAGLGGSGNSADVVSRDGASEGSPAPDSAGSVVPSGATVTAVRAEPHRQVPLVVLFGPLLLALALIATGAVLEVTGVEMGVVSIVSQPVIALLIGLIGTSLVTRYVMGQEGVEQAVRSGFRESGQILILTGVGGSLAAAIKAAGLGEILGQYFSASSAAPLLMVWVIAAVLHIAVGSVTISAITAAGMLAPVAPLIGLNPVLIALAAGAGSLFAVHVTSNTFWLLQSLMGQTTRGTLKTCSVGVSVASIVAILLIIPMSLVV